MELWMTNKIFECTLLALLNFFGRMEHFAVFIPFVQSPTKRLNAESGVIF